MEQAIVINKEESQTADDVNALFNMEGDEGNTPLASDLNYRG